MITQIFYSLVLFPKINYDSSILWYHIFWIEEGIFWSVKLVLKNKEKFEEIFFTHKNFAKEKSLFNTKNWQISWKNREIVECIFDLVSIDEYEDFNFYKDKSFYDKIPFWVVLTLTSKCNLFCNYCFNDYDYSLKDRNKIEWLSASDYKKMIDILYDSWTRDIIITWWEPFTSPILFEVLEYIKNKWIFIRINTNGTLLSDGTLNKLNRDFSLNLMVSLHEFNNEDYYKINKDWAEQDSWKDTSKWFEKQFEQKVVQLKKIKQYKNLTLDILTILTKKNILYLEKIYKYVLSNFDIQNWHFFRQYANKQSEWISKEMLALAIYKINKLNKKYFSHFKIVDSVPFCIIKDVELASEVIEWELSAHHNVKTIITPEWEIQIMCAFDTNLWNIFKKDLLKVWQWAFVQKMFNNWFLPKECWKCKYKNDCMWWSRMQANIYNGSYWALDPFTNLNNIKSDGYKSS